MCGLACSSHHPWQSPSSDWHHGADTIDTQYHQAQGSSTGRCCSLSAEFQIRRQVVIQAATQQHHSAQAITAADVTARDTVQPPRGGLLSEGSVIDVSMGEPSACRRQPAGCSTLASSSANTDLVGEPAHDTASTPVGQRVAEPELHGAFSRAS